MKDKDKQSQAVNDEQVQLLKDKGNECFKNKKFEEAVLHYTHAIKIDPSNYSLFSNRSSAFLHLQQYYLALEDAKETIRLQPNWAKGYFRKGEVEFQTFNFFDALVSYQSALIFKPGDQSIESAIEKAKFCSLNEKRADEKIPWLGAGIGIIIGVSIVIADHIFTDKPSLVHPIAMVLVTIVVALFGYGGCRAYRAHLHNQRSSMLDPPLDLLGDKDKSSEPDEEVEKMKPRYTKAQARHRFKKGKS